MRLMDGPAGNLRKTSWWVSALLWSSIALFDATQTVVVMHAEGMHHKWGLLFLSTFLSFVPWFIATPLALELARRFPPVHLRPVSTWFIHVGACLGVCVVHSGWQAMFLRVLNPYLYKDQPSFVELWRSQFSNGLLSSFVLYGVILLMGQMLESRERIAQQQTETARLNEALSRAQLDSLRRQIEPHFLFNALNTVAALVREERNDAAIKMIAGLSDCLRRVLEGSEKQEVTLGEEMEFLGKYLEIQKLRFADRLDVQIDVPEELYAAQVPSLILQPMVENAIKHGISQRARGGSVCIGAARLGGVLTLRVYNDGPTLPVDWESTRSGIGIPNVRTRLQSLYGGDCELRMRNRDQGVEVSLSVPFREAP
jgi:two-component system LytT family sensor kinase